ncbi:MAG: hypothetical protein IPP90_19335 [Gemmatimonadaceae bacterium]|nr:hypothetical protein [Gemmatimonadaceae bacterium]
MNHPSLAALPLVRRRIGEAEVAATPAIVDDLAALVASHGTAYEWAAQQPQPRALRGRAPVYVAALPASNDLVVVRHAWHGGLLAPLSTDRFRNTRRAEAEYATSVRLRQHAVPTTDVLGFVSYPAGFGCVRVDVVSRLVQDAFDLGMIVAGLVPEIDRDDALAATRTLLLRLAAEGVVHPDLNVKNILVVRASTGHLTAMVIDVDVVRWDAGRTPADTMEANVARLIRSMRKWRRQFGCPLSDDLLEQFARAARAGTDDGARR